MSTDARRARGLRSRPRFGLLVIVALAVAIFFVSRGCQSEGIDISKDEAIAIAREEVDFTPDEEQVRIVRRGLTSKPHWAVGLAQHGADGQRTKTATVLVEADTGKVVEVRIEGEVVRRSSE